jgi:hypothetical protein
MGRACFTFGEKLVNVSTNSAPRSCAFMIYRSETESEHD